MPVIFVFVFILALLISGIFVTIMRPGDPTGGLLIIVSIALFIFLVVF